MTNIDRKSLIKLYLKNMLREKYDSAENWDDLGNFFNINEILRRNRRLYDSLKFGDSDYGSVINTILTEASDQDPDFLDKLAEHEDLAEYLRNSNPKAYSEIYGAAHGVIQTVANTAMQSSFDVNRFITRINASLHDDPELAIGTAKELIEAVLKQILSDHGETDLKDDMPQLMKRVAVKMSIDPKSIAPTTPGEAALKALLANLLQIPQQIGTLRNLYGTGHGQQAASKIDTRHAQVAVTSAGALCSFLIDTHRIQMANLNTTP